VHDLRRLGQESRHPLSRASFDRLLAAAGLPDPAEAVAEVTRLGCGIWAIDPSLVSNLFALARAQPDALAVVNQLEAGRMQIMEHLVQRLREADALAAGLSPRDAADLLVAATSFASWDQIVSARHRPPGTATRLIVRLALRAVT
jgi:uncharacterized membrane protein YccC